MENLSYLPGFKEDILKLVDSARKMTLQILIRVGRGELPGTPLEDHANTGYLRDCFKIRFDHDPSFGHEGEFRFRLVYRLLPGSTSRRMLVQAVAVGRRQNLEVYRRAIENLGRETDGDQESG